MGDGRLRVVIAGDIYTSRAGVRPFLEGSGYEVAGEASSADTLLDAVREQVPDAVVVGDELVDEASLATIREAAPDAKIVVVTWARVEGLPPGPADAYLRRGAPLASLTDLLANLLLLPPPPLVAAAAEAVRVAERAGSDRLRFLQFVAAAALLLSVGALALLFSGAGHEMTGTRAVGGPATGTAPFTSPAASPLDAARDALEQLVSAVQGGRFDRATGLAQALAEDRQRAMEGGYSVASLDAEVTSRLQPLVGGLPAEVVPTLRSILGDLLPPVPSQIQLVGTGVFGGVPVGSTAGPVRVIVRNAGAEDVTIEEVQLAGAAASEFSQRSDCAGASLRPGGTCTVEVSFAPLSPGDKQAALTVVAPPPTAAPTLAMSGTGVGVPAVDTAPPVIVCAPVGAGWHATDVVIPCTARDAGSGLADPGDASFDLPTHVPTGSEDANASTEAATVCDEAGKCAQAGPFDGIKVDERAPVVACERSDRSWSGRNVEVLCRSVDRGSGLARETDAAFSLSTNVPQGAQNESARTGTRAVCDAVGNCTTAGPVDGLRVDRRPPRVACDRPNVGWHADDVQVTCTADDSGAGLADPGDASFTLRTNVAFGTEDATAATDTRRVCDAVGNCTTAGPVDGLRIDKAPPRISLTRFADGSTFLLNEAVSAAASVQCGDGGSGVASCSVPDTVDTSAVGTFSLTATATDRVGNTSTASVQYTVTYGIELRYDPSEPTRRIALRLVDANGENVSSSEVVVSAVDIDGTIPLGGRFRYSKSAGEYFFTVPGRVDSGPHILHFTAGDDPVVHSAPFVSP